MGKSRLRRDEGRRLPLLLISFLYLLTSRLPTPAVVNQAKMMRTLYQLCRVVQIGGDQFGCVLTPIEYNHIAHPLTSYYTQLMETLHNWALVGSCAPNLVFGTVEIVMGFRSKDFGASDSDFSHHRSHPFPGSSVSGVKHGVFIYFSKVRDADNGGGTYIEQKHFMNLEAPLDTASA